MGLFAALEARRRGLEPIVFEAGRVGEALFSWGSARLFSPVAMNVPESARRLLGPGVDPDALLTGPEMVERVLLPLARSLDGRVRTGLRVAAVSRAGMRRGDFASHPLRAERPFRLLLDTAAGEETFEADAVLDASGAATPCLAGAGGMPAPGERRLGARVLRRLGDVEEGLPAMAGGSVLLLGHGHSAATALGWMAELAARSPATRVTWAVRTGNRRPCAEVADDPLPERRRVSTAANDLAGAPPEFLRVERRAVLESLSEERGRLRAALSGGRGGLFDAVIALTGYRPDWSFVSELALEISPATEGARGLSLALARVTDCLSMPAVSARDLASGEPGFFAIGAKSYGRSRHFLLRSGLAQLETVLDILAGPAGASDSVPAAGAGGVSGKAGGFPAGCDQG
jgi:hypothetical protein